jgi:acetyl esterase/lipase
MIESIKSVAINSSYDGKLQNIRYYRSKNKNRPLVTSLHSWSYGYNQDLSSEHFSRCIERDWNCIFPDFRGPNNNPEACGSDAAMQDIRDAVSWAAKELVTDPRRFFLTGESGGGFASLLAASQRPSAWTAVSAWVPISDLEKWYYETSVRKLRYAGDLEKVCGCKPGVSNKIDSEYKKRSPIHNIWRAHIIPMDINAGIHDGHNGNSVPVGQSIRAFNELAKASQKKEDVIDDEIIDYIERNESVPDWFDKGNTADGSYNRKIHLRRISSLSRLTIFEGGHEMLYDAAFAWFEKF